MLLVQSLDHFAVPLPGRRGDVRGAGGRAEGPQGVRLPGGEDPRFLRAAAHRREAAQAQPRLLHGLRLHVRTVPPPVVRARQDGGQAHPCHGGVRQGRPGALPPGEDERDHVLPRRGSHGHRRGEPGQRGVPREHHRGDQEVLPVLPQAARHVREGNREHHRQGRPRVVRVRDAQPAHVLLLHPEEALPQLRRELPRQQAPGDAGAEGQGQVLRIVLPQLPQAALQRRTRQARRRPLRLLHQEVRAHPVPERRHVLDAPDREGEQGHRHPRQGVRAPFRLLRRMALAPRQPHHRLGTRHQPRRPRLHLRAVHQRPRADGRVLHEGGHHRVHRPQHHHPVGLDQGNGEGGCRFW